jgi:hypothetical protein
MVKTMKTIKALSFALMATNLLYLLASSQLKDWLGPRFPWSNSITHLLFYASFVLVCILHYTYNHDVKKQAARKVELDILINEAHSIGKKLNAQIKKEHDEM